MGQCCMKDTTIADGLLLFVYLTLTDPLRIQPWSTHESKTNATSIFSVQIAGPMRGSIVLYVSSTVGHFLPYSTEVKKHTVLLE